MNKDTPLAEVAHHLSAHTAAMVGAEDSDVQIFTLAAVRDCVIHLEAIEVQLDPMQYAAVLDVLVTSVVPLAKHVARTARGWDVVKLRVSAADQILRSIIGEGGGIPDGS